VILAAICGAGNVKANGEAEYEAPVDRPVSAHPERPLPFPIVDEPVPRGTPSIALEPLPTDFAYLSTPNFASATKHDNGVGEKRECFESVLIRGSTVAAGKVTIPPGGLGYVSEAWPGALPLRQDVICVGGVPYRLVDLEQAIVTRKNVTLALGESTVLGSEVFRFRSATQFGDLRSAVVEVTALSGFDWARLGTGSLEVSTTEPGWHARTFHYGMHQGRVEEVTPKSVKFAWLSGLRTESVVLAGKREFAGKLGVGSETPLDGAKIKILRIDPTALQVDIETPDGRKSLVGAGDLRSLPADTAARKRLIATGTKYAYVLVPDASDWNGRQVYLEIYSNLRSYRSGDTSSDDKAFKAYPLAHYTGAVLGIYWVNDQAVELSPSASVASGPSGAFKLSSSWSASGDLTGIVLEDRKGQKSGSLPASGRKSINLIAGAGPTVDALLSRVGSGTVSGLHELWSVSTKVVPDAKGSAAAAKADAPLTRADLFRPERIRAALPWALFSAAIGLVIGFGLGRVGRKRSNMWD